MKRLLPFLAFAAAALAAGSAWADAQPVPQPTMDDVVRLVADKLQAKYRAEVDRTCDRLWDKVKAFSASDREEILTAMRRSVDRKVSQVRGLDGLDPVRRQADLDLLQYVGRKLDALVDRVP